jgi:riboflavin synthase
MAAMFTGIVQSKGRIAQLQRNDFGVRLVIDRCGWKPTPQSDADLALGGREPRVSESICVSGVCLTVVQTDGQMLHFDVIAETLAKTTLGDKREGDSVNLEPAVSASQPMGGHFMQGHVDGVGVVSDVHAGKDEWRITIAPPESLWPYITPKGSVAIDGVSLTIAAVHGQGAQCGSRFDVALIPTTLELTTLSDLKSRGGGGGDRVNLEADILAKTVVHVLRHHLASLHLTDASDTPKITMDTLRAAGFAG